MNASVYTIVAALSSFRRMQRWMRVLPSRVACVLNERVGRIDRHFSGSRLLAAAAANEPPPAAGAATTDNEANGSKSRNSRSQVQTWDRPVLVTVTILDSFDSGQFRSRDDVDDGALVRANVGGRGCPVLGDSRGAEAVSYTHLTLPTICSV